MLEVLVGEEEETMPPEQTSDNFSAIVRKRTNGRPYIFVITGFAESRRRVCELMSEVAKKIDMACLLTNNVRPRGTTCSRRFTSSSNMPTSLSPR